jgi:hypothetical protein
MRIASLRPTLLLVKSAEGSDPITIDIPSKFAAASESRDLV